jgi:small conductance mechanosensitive channel
MSSTNDSSDNEIKRETRPNLHETSKRKISLSKFLVAFVIVVMVIVVIELVIEYQLHERYKTYLRIGEVAIIGYFTINSIGNIFYKYTFDSLDKNAEAGRVLIRIMGAVIIIAIIISYLSRDPLVAASIGTVTAIVIGFASQNILGNTIAGLYLAITRPFKIGDKITIFGNTGIVFDIGLQNSRLKTEQGDIIIAPNSAILGTTIVIRAS